MMASHALAFLPISYCTNVHPGETLQQLEESLRRFSFPLAERLRDRGGIGLGCWLSRRVVAELSGSAALRESFAAALREHSIPLSTLNAFPMGDFHAARVKEQVYHPDWLSEARVEYTTAAAKLLASWLPEGKRGTLSTLAGAFRQACEGEEKPRQVVRNVARVALELHRLRLESGRSLRLCLEPEPFTMLETREETAAFFQDVLPREAQHVFEKEGVGKSQGEEVLAEHVGVCLDACHQAVEFEEAAATARRWSEAGVPIGKVQLGCALELQEPGRNPEAVARLRQYREERWLHQVTGRRRDGTLLCALDLPEVLEKPAPEWLELEAWRIHYHVPVHWAPEGPLRTTQGELARLLDWIRDTAPAAQLEIETYTWEVLPRELRRGAGGPACRSLPARAELGEAGGGAGRKELVEGLAREFEWVLDRLQRGHSHAAIL